MCHEMYQAEYYMRFADPKTRQALQKAQEIMQLAYDTFNLRLFRMAQDMTDEIVSQVRAKSEVQTMGANPFLAYDSMTQYLGTPTEPNPSPLAAPSLQAAGYDLNDNSGKDAVKLIDQTAARLTGLQKLYRDMDDIAEKAMAEKRLVVAPLVSWRNLVTGKTRFSGVKWESGQLALRP